MIRTALLLLALAACGDKRSDLPPATRGSGSGSATSTPTGAPDNVVRRVRDLTPTMSAETVPPPVLPQVVAFELTTPGTGKLAPLRYTRADGSSEHAIKAELTTRQLEGVDFSAPVTVPPITDHLQVAMTANSIVVHVKPPTIEGPTTPAAEAYVASLAGTLKERRVRVTLDDRGQLGPIALLDDPTGSPSTLPARDEIAQRMLAVVVPFPAEPVGIGATWTVAHNMRQGPVYLKQTATYRLDERTATGLKLHVTITRMGEPQLVADPALPPGTYADLIALVRTLEGDITVDPSKPLATAGTLTLHSTMHVRFTTKTGPVGEQIVEDTGTLTLSTTNK